MELSTSVTLSPDVLFQELEGEAVLLNMATEQYYGLDDVGTRIWLLLEKYRDLEQVITNMLAEYDVSEALLRQDVYNFATEMSESGLIIMENT